MNNYVSLTDAMSDLRTRGYNADFDLGERNFGIPCEHQYGTVSLHGFRVDEVHLFRANAATDQHSILFAITSSAGIKGLLIDQYAKHLTKQLI